MRVIHPGEVIAGCEFEQFPVDPANTYHVFLYKSGAYIGDIQIEEENGQEFYRVITVDGIQLEPRDTDRSLAVSIFRLRNLKPATTAIAKPERINLRG